MSKIVRWGLIIFVVWYVVTYPTQASGLIHSGIGLLESAATSGANFISSL